MGILHRSSPAVGVVTQTAVEGYDSVLVGAVISALQAGGARPVCFLESSRQDLAQGRFDEIISSRTIDGLVVVGAIPISEDTAAQVARVVNGLPTVQISEEHPQITSLIVDNEAGMREAVRHLIGLGRREIAFVRGPQGHPEAEARFRAYRAELVASGVGFDPKLIAPGAFWEVSGTAAVRLLLDERGAQPDAIIAANDWTALGVLKALVRRGVHVPDDIALVGFDDAPFARSTVPPLTTVRQPLEAMGRRAAELILAQLRGEPVPQLEAFATELVVRRSCGARRRSMLPALVDNDAAAPPASGAPAADRAGLSGFGEVVSQELGKPGISRAEMAELNRAFSEAAAGVGSSFIELFQRTVDKIAQHGANSRLWLHALTALSDAALALAKQPGTGREVALLCEAIRITSETAQETRARDGLLQRAHMDSLGRVYARLGELEDISEFAPLLGEEAANLQLAALHVLLFDAGDPSWMRVVYSSLVGDVTDLRVRSQRLLPEDALSASGPQPFYVLPLGIDGRLGRLIAQARFDQVRFLHNFKNHLTGVLSRVLRGPMRSRSVAPQSGTAPSNQFGRYRLVRPLGRGGMARVYLAQMEMLPGIVRHVALKVIDASTFSVDNWQRQLAEEVRAAGLIRHPNVVPILEVGQENDQFFMVMEYVEGDNLATLADRTRAVNELVPAAIVGRILSEVLAGLHAAHEATDHDGIPMHLVHRDFSPQNILVGVDGVTRLTDFGIAKTADTPTSTEVGVLKGKVRYMSPEQAMGKPIDRRTDIWAAGVVAWELLAGRRLHQEQSDAAVLLKIVTDFPRELSEVRSDVPEVVARVVQKALMLEAPDRYATAADFRAQLLEAWQVSWGLADNDEVGAWARRMVSTTMEDTLNVPTTVVGARTRR